MNFRERQNLFIKAMPLRVKHEKYAPTVSIETRELILICFPWINDILS